MASLKDVAKLANVSLMTVSRALNSPERLKPETLARVQAAIEQTNYVPDLSAKKIRGAHATPNTIGVLALDTVTTPFSVEITLSIEETARAHGWNSFVVNMFSDDSPETIVDLLLSHRPDGIIYTTMGLRQVPLPAKLLTLRTGQLRKPARSGRQLYSGRRTGPVYGGTGAAGRWLSPPAVPASSGQSSGHRPPPRGTGARLPGSGY